MRRFKSFISLIAVSLIVTSCAAGPNAQTTTQGPTGSGDYAKVGDIYVQNVVIVKGNENVGTVVATLINDSTEDDQLVSVSVDNPAPKSVVFSPANEINIPAKKLVTIGVNSESPHVDLIEFAPRQSSFVKITFVFKKAGIVDQVVLVKPNTGIYEGIAPLATAPKSAAQEGREIIAGSLKDVSITVLNGTRRAGFARSVADTLQVQGMRIVEVADASNKDTAQTQIVYAPGFAAKAEAIAKLISVGVLVEDPNQTSANIIITLGNDAPFNL
ncbi:MAG: LytR C-terminal domain-containing protein [Candidatus Nanopelagicales bacterium]